METIQIEELILEGISINEQIQKGDKTARDFEGAEIAIVRDGQIKRIRPRNEEDTQTLPDGTWQVTVDEYGDFDSDLSWYIMNREGSTVSAIGFIGDDDRSSSLDEVYKVVGRASESTTENRIITVGDERFLMVDGQAYLIHE